MTEEQIKYMVERFLNWPLPENFNPDGGVSFEPHGNVGTPHQFKRNPSGTNLLDYVQAETMVRHLIEGLPAAAAAPLLGSNTPSPSVSTPTDSGAEGNVPASTLTVTAAGGKPNGSEGGKGGRASTVKLTEEIKTAAEAYIRAMGEMLEPVGPEFRMVSVLTDDDGKPTKMVYMHLYFEEA